MNQPLPGERVAAPARNIHLPNNSFPRAELSGNSLAEPRGAGRPPLPTISPKAPAPAVLAPPGTHSPVGARSARSRPGPGVASPQRRERGRGCSGQSTAPPPGLGTHCRRRSPPPPPQRPPLAARASSAGRATAPVGRLSTAQNAPAAV